MEKNWRFHKPWSQVSSKLPQSVSYFMVKDSKIIQTTLSQSFYTKHHVAGHHRWPLETTPPAALFSERSCRRMLWNWVKISQRSIRRASPKRPAAMRTGYPGLVVSGITSSRFLQEILAGWWFQTWLLWLFHHIGFMSSSQLTFTPSFFRGVGQ